MRGFTRITVGLASRTREGNSAGRICSVNAGALFFTKDWVDCMIDTTKPIELTAPDSETTRPSSVLKILSLTVRSLLERATKVRRLQTSHSIWTSIVIFIRRILQS